MGLDGAGRLHFLRTKPKCSSAWHLCLDGHSRQWLHRFRQRHRCAGCQCPNSYGNGRHIELRSTKFAIDGNFVSYWRHMVVDRAGRLYFQPAEPNRKYTGHLHPDYYRWEWLPRCNDSNCNAGQWPSGCRCFGWHAQLQQYRHCPFGQFVNAKCHLQLDGAGRLCFG